MKNHLLPLILLTGLTLLAPASRGADAPKPLKVLLITGGCCHDYKKQKDILKTGLEARAHVTVDQMHVDDSSTKPRLPLYGNPDYAKGYDLVIHDECSADLGDPAVIAGVLQPHLDGLPAVNLHCAMHSYRFGNYRDRVAVGADNAKWFEYLGLQSSGHGPQEPIEITFTDPASPITKGLATWTTIKEELYNNVQVFPGAQALAKGKQITKSKKKQPDGTETVEEKTTETVVVWTNVWNNKTRVFSTTIGHNNATVEDARYLDLVTRGVLWATNHLNPDGTPATGYGPGGK